MQWPFTTEQTISGLSAAFTAAVALSAVVVTYLFATRNFDRERLNQRLKYFEDIRRWADQVADILTEAIHLCDLCPTKVQGESFFDRRHRLRIAVSAMIDRGRWFFPNLEVDDLGADKELGYRGYRHELLDGLVVAYKCLQKMDYQNGKNNLLLRQELTDAKRHFVGRMQTIIDPSATIDEFARINSKRTAQKQVAA